MKSASFLQVLYCLVWPVWLYHIFPHYFINGMIVERKFEYSIVLSPQFFSKNPQKSKLMIIRPEGVEFFHTKEQTDRRDEDFQFCEHV
jgi:hypothetical protein